MIDIFESRTQFIKMTPIMQELNQHGGWIDNRRQHSGLHETSEILYQVRTGIDQEPYKE